MHKSSLTNQEKTLWTEQKKARIICTALTYAAQLNEKKGERMQQTELHKWN